MAWVYWTRWSVNLAISISIKQVACERLFHFHPLRRIARQLGVSADAVRDWRIFLNNGDFAWSIERNVMSRKPQLLAEVGDWITHYPIGYSDVAKAHASDLLMFIEKFRLTLKRVPLLDYP